MDSKLAVLEEYIDRKARRDKPSSKPDGKLNNHKVDANITPAEEKPPADNKDETAEAKPPKETNGDEAEAKPSEGKIRTGEESGRINNLAITGAGRNPESTEDRQIITNRTQADGNGASDAYMSGASPEGGQPPPQVNPKPIDGLTDEENRQYAHLCRKLAKAAQLNRTVRQAMQQDNMQ